MATKNYDDLVAQINEIAANPDSFGDFLMGWDDILDSLPKEGSAEVQEPDLAYHIARAERILSRFERNPRLPPPMRQSIELDPNPAMLVTSSGQILAANCRALKSFGADTRDAVAAIVRADARGAKRLRALCRQAQIASHPGQPVTGLVWLESGPSQVMVFTRVTCPHEPRIVGLLTSRRPIWVERTSDLVKEFFGLTEAETQIAQDLILGTSSTDIAARRGKSVHTVRSQIKAVLGKTGFGSQVELIRNLGFLEGTFEAELPSDPRSLSEWKTVTNSAGRRVPYKVVGPVNGTPVLYIHGLIDSLDFSNDTLSALERYNIRLIAPVRPHFGTAEPVPGRDDPLSVTLADILAVLDHEHLARVPVLGHMAGAFYGSVFAQRCPSRVIGVMSLAGGVPMKFPWQISQMSRGHRISAQAARNAPALLRILILGGIHRLRSRGEDAMWSLYHSDGGLDKAHSHAPEILALLMNRFEFATVQGYRAFFNDILRVSSDWSSLVPNLEVPVVFCHGVQDKVVLSRGVELWASQLPTATVHLVPHAGQLILTQKPDLVMQILSDLAERRPADRPKALI